MKTIRSSFYKSTLLAVCMALLTVTVAFAAAGQLDASFSEDGKVIEGFGGMGSRAWDVAVQPDGKVVTVGTKYGSGSANDMSVARYNADGNLDPTFSDDGKLTISFGHSDSGMAVVIQTDGKIVVGGETCNTSFICDVAVARLNPDGTMDASFGGDGTATADFDGEDNGGYDIALNNGKIVVVGYQYKQGNYDGVICQFTAGGALDKTFGGGDGVVYVSSAETDLLNAVAVSGGKIYVTGSRSPSNNSTSNVLTVRLTANGTFDSAFGDGGIVETNLGGYDWGRGIAVSGGKTVVVGGSNKSFFIVRYASNGALDNSFSGDGKVVATLGYPAPSIRSVAFQGTKIVIAGFTNYSGTTSDTLLARYNPGGALDTTFGNSGKVATNWSGFDGYNSVAYKNGRIYAVGISATNSKRFTVGVYLP